MPYDIVQTSAADTLPPFDASTFWTQFRHDVATVRGVRLHFVEGGRGAPLLLLPGWPQSWYAWRYVMPLLDAAGRRVGALGPRGMGDSDWPNSDYDMRTVVAEVHEFSDVLGLTAEGPMDVVGHDVETWIGYAYAAEWASEVGHLAVFDAALPGITPPAAGIP
jgi:pimeloyl-ACP methyl ester carboxylesterase